MVVFVFALLLDMLAVGSRETETYAKVSLSKSNYKSFGKEFLYPFHVISKHPKIHLYFNSF